MDTRYNTVKTKISRRVHSNLQEAIIPLHWRSKICQLIRPIMFASVYTVRSIKKNIMANRPTPKAVTVLPIKVLTASAPALKSGKQYFRASWKKTSSTSGYQIQYSLYKNFKKPVTKTLTGNTKTSITVSRLKRQKRYYVRVRAYRNANFKKYYGKWSKTKSIVVK